MFTCPNKNIHSLYIDNELAQPYKNSFEEHLAQCPSCAKKHASYVAMSNSVYDDTFKISKKKFEEGYMRLKAHLRYKEVTASAQSAWVVSYMLKSVPFMVVALGFVILFPLTLSYKKTNQDSFENVFANNSLLTTIRDNPPNIALIQEQGIVVNGNISTKRASLQTTTGQNINLNALKLAENVFMPNLPKHAIQIQINLFRVSDLPLSQDKIFTMPVAFLADPEH